MNKQAEKSYLQQISQLMIENFKTRYPDLDVEKLKATNPPSLMNVDLSNKEMAQIKLHQVTIGVLCATVFGDASLDTSSANPRIQFNHSTRQKDWFFWKCFCGLQGLTNETSVSFKLPDGKQVNSPHLPGEVLGKLHVNTLRNEKQTQLLHKLSGSQKKKEIKRSWLNHMNDYFLMTLWLDDGSLTTYNREGVLCVNSMNIEEAKILADYFNAVWGIKCTARVVTSRSTVTNPSPVEIAITDLENLKKLLRIIAPIVPVESMIYKVCLCPIDSSDQQRWASELKGLVRKEWHNTIDTYMQFQNASREAKTKKKTSGTIANQSEEDIVQEN